MQPQPTESPNDQNPYQAPNEAATEQTGGVEVIGRASGGRFLAAQIDHGFGVVLFLFVAMNTAEPIGDVAAFIAAITAYLGYYFLPEWLFGATIGKSFFNLRVRQLSGAPCTAQQAALRTVMRLFEVNPLFLGALPAGIAILKTQKRQRLGDLLAGTVVTREDHVGVATPAIKIVRR